MEDNTPRRIDPLVILVAILALCLVIVLVGKGCATLVGPEDTTPTTTLSPLPTVTTAPTTAPKSEAKRG